MPTHGKLLCLAIMAIMVFSSLIVSNQTTATNVASLITNDTTWTLEGSPYSLTGPTAVNKGVTLTIEPGVVVNLNDYYIQVNGTLIAAGTDSQHITFNGGSITFTEVSNDWNQQTGKGSKIEYSEITNTPISSIQGLKINHNNLVGSLTTGNNSAVTNNKIQGTLTVGYSSTIEDNTISGLIQTFDNLMIKNNIVTGKISTGSSCTISGNKIITDSQQSNTYGDDYNLRVGYHSTIINNEITGIVTGNPAEIRGNTIQGGAHYTVFFMDYSEVTVAAVDIDSVCKFTSNTIKGISGEAITARDGTFADNIIVGAVQVSKDSVFQHNTISGNVRGGDIFKNNRIFGSITPSSSNPTVSSNAIEGSIYCLLDGIATIKDNIITSGNIQASGTIKNNLITEGYGTGITTGTAPVTIEGNTISKRTLAISVSSDQAIITNNNFENNNQSVSLTGSGNVSAINNWWGTTDEQAISDSIHDFKNDFNLGTVTFKPFLTSRNEQAAPTQNMNLPNTTPITSEPNPTTSSSNNGSSIIKLLTWPILDIYIIVAGAAIVIFLLYIWRSKKTSNKKAPENN